MVLGMMSGTSLDGLDLCLVKFLQVHDSYAFEIVKAQTLPYTKVWRNRLAEAHNLSGFELHALDIAYGNWLGKQAKQFLGNHRPSCIASHGHTVFHAPHKGLSLQIGHGGAIHVQSELPVICDFRIEDVLEGGQGAPLVPVGDALLFPQYAACLNLGGFSNLSWNDAQGLRRASDLIPINMVLNRLAQRLGFSMDTDGHLAARGVVDNDLVHTLQSLDLWQRPFPRSFGREDVDAQVWPLVSEYPSVPNALASCTYWMAHYLAETIQSLCQSPASASQAKPKVLVTGGGAKHPILMEGLGNLAPNIEWIVPDDSLVDFKEALIFAFLAWLKLSHKPNVWKEVTGARQSGSRGQVWGT